MHSDQTRIRIGAAVSFLLIVGVVFALQIDFRKLGPSIRVHMYLAHPGTLQPGADVQLGGRVVGRIASIRLVSAREAREPSHPLYPTGGVLVVVKLRKKFLPWIDRGSQFFVNSKGIIGESYLEVVPTPKDVALTGPLRDHEEIRGIDPTRMEQVIVTGFLNTKRFAALMRDLQPDMESLAQEWEALAVLRREIFGEAPPVAENFQKLSLELRALNEAWTRDEVSLSQLMAQSQSLVARSQGEFSSMQSEWTTLRNQLAAIGASVDDARLATLGAALRAAEEDIATLQHSLVVLATLAERVSQGMGTIGALVNDPEFSDDAKKLGRYLKRHPWQLLKRPIFDE